MTVSKRIAVVLLLLIPRDLCYAEKESSVLPIEAFASLPRVSSVRFSPSGKYLAVLRNENGMTYLMTQLASGADPHVVVNSDNSEYFIQDYQWVNDERLLVGVRFGSSREHVESVETRLMAVNRDGTEAKHSLIAPRRDALLADHYSQSQDRIIGQMPGDQRHVLIALDKENPNIPNVYQLDVYSGGLTLVQANPGNREGIGAIRHWLADRQGRVRAGISDSKTMRRVMIRRKSSGQWEELVEFDRTKERGIVPLGFDENPDILYVRATHEGRWAVFKVNPEEPRAPRQLVAADPHMDIDGELLYSRWLRAVVGVAHSSVRRPYLYWDERFQRLHSRLDRLLPGRHTRIVSSTDDGKRHVVVSVSARGAIPCVRQRTRAPREVGTGLSSSPIRGHASGESGHDPCERRARVTRLPDSTGHTVGWTRAVDRLSAWRASLARYRDV